MVLCQIDKRRKSLIAHQRSFSCFLTFPNISIILVIFSRKAFRLPNEVESTGQHFRARSSFLFCSSALSEPGNLVSQMRLTTSSFAFRRFLCSKILSCNRRQRSDISQAIDILNARSSNSMKICMNKRENEVVRAFMLADGDTMDGDIVWRLSKGLWGSKSTEEKQVWPYLL